MSDVLCIYYSFSGNTRRAMKALLRETVDMYPLSLEGLDAALKRLMVNR